MSGVKEAAMKTAATSGDCDEAKYQTMMEALDAFFHMAVCPNHSAKERGEALQLARTAFIDYAYDGDDPEEGEPEVVAAGKPAQPGIGNHDQRVLGDDDKQNAPSTNTIN